MAKHKRSISSISQNEDLKENETHEPTFCNENKMKMNYSYLSNYLKIGLSIYGIYLLWILLHFGATQMYVIYCVPNTWFGFLTSPFLTTTPHCQGLRWIIYNGGNQITNMWLSIGSWIYIKLIV